MLPPLPRPRQRTWRPTNVFASVASCSVTVVMDAGRYAAEGYATRMPRIIMRRCIDEAAIPMRHALEKLGRQVEFDGDFNIAVGNHSGIDNLSTSDESIHIGANFVALCGKGGNRGSTGNSKTINALGEVAIRIDLSRADCHQSLLGGRVLTVTARRAVAGGGYLGRGRHQWGWRRCTTRGGASAQDRHCKQAS